MSTVDMGTVVIVLGCKANLRISRGGKVPVWGNLEKFDIHGDGSVERMPLWMSTPFHVGGEGRGYGDVVGAW
jgi:hypothetical protein